MNKSRKVAEFRATLKSLEEQRADVIAEMETLLEGIKEESRAFSEEENQKYEDLRKKVDLLDSTIDAEERARKISNAKTTKKEENDPVAAEERAFASYIKSQCGVFVEQRAGEQNVTMANNGAVIPTTIANRIITTVKEMCPILAKATIFNVKGTLKVPVYGLANTTHDITVGYQTEFTDITADAGAFTSVDLSGFLAGALTLIGKSVINNADVDVVSFIVNEMSKKIALFLEKELLLGTTDKAEGALSTTTNVNAGSISAITSDNLVDLQSKIPTVYQGDACWIMNPATFTALKKLKDGNDQYLLQNNFSQDFPYAILGKPVYLSDNMPVIASAAKTVLYGDLSGLAVNMRENIQVQILQEKYATQHAIGVVSWFEFDSDVIDNQKLATLTMSV